jgi:hypothetical protein
MKTRQLYSIVLKIIGIIALWHFITILSVVILSGFGFVTQLFATSGHSSAAYAIIPFCAFLLQGLLPLLIAFYCLFRTNQLLHLFQLEDETMLELSTEKKVIYHVLVLLFGVLLLINGANEFLSVDYVNSENGFLNNLNTTDNTGNRVSPVYSKSTHVNFLAFFELLAGVFLLVKSKSISQMIIDKTDLK